VLIARQPRLRWRADAVLKTGCVFLELLTVTHMCQRLVVCFSCSGVGACKHVRRMQAWRRKHVRQQVQHLCHRTHICMACMLYTIAFCCRPTAALLQCGMLLLDCMMFLGRCLCSMYKEKVRGLPACGQLLVVHALPLLAAWWVSVKRKVFNVCSARSSGPSCALLAC
jgi:hypothetical protein